MHILVVGNVLKDVYLNLDSRTEKFEPDKSGVEWLDFSFNASKHRYFSRLSSFGGAAITLEVLQKMGLSADISDTSFHFDGGGPVASGPTGTYRYILTADNGVSYMVPSGEQKTTFTTPETAVDYLFIDRSAYLTPGVVDKITAYLDYSRKTKLVLYLKDFSVENLSGLVKRANLVFLENNRGGSEDRKALQWEKNGENTRYSGNYVDSDARYSGMWGKNSEIWQANVQMMQEFPREKIVYISERQLQYLDYTENIAVSRIDRLTHLSAYSIIAATVLGGFILGKTVEYSLRMARINVENATLDSTLSLDELDNIAASTSESNLELIAAALMVPGKGILAADESGGSIKKKFASVNVADNFENRHAYREMLLSTPDLEQYVSGVILFDETARDTMDNGQPVPDYLIGRGIVPGVKVDEGLAELIDLPDAPAEAVPGEKYTKGLDALPARLRNYYQMGLRFAKWRAAFSVEVEPGGGFKTPTYAAIKENCRILAEYAASCQSAGLVPIVEPEVAYDGDYSLDQCARITRRVLEELFKALKRHGVNLKACILKVNMVMAGKRYSGVEGVSSGGDSVPEEVGRATARLLSEYVPAELAGVVFLSGGQTPEQATANLEAIMRRQPFAWPVTFSFSRALQNPALEAWGGKMENTEAGKAALLERLLENTNALR